ncbi:MAG TPA: phosphatase PAP2 family protein [Acidimicrobiia bacterium]|jgi:membrane-associated phospholipid phosphatase|nr:phosphatase PAP2 family protein [Acidimicrobiia bacterium]
MKSRTEPSRDSSFTASRRVFAGMAVVASCLVIVVYVIAVRTSWGQHLDAAAVKGRRNVLSKEGVRVAHTVHTTIDIASLVLFGGTIVGIAVLRGRVRLAAGVAAIIVGSLATTELLKRVLPRPDLGVADALRNAPSYPSGHTTIAMALSIGAILVAPRRLRAGVAVIGVAFASAIGCSVVVTASHRPSDVVGAALVVTAWSTATIAYLLRSTELGHSSQRRSWMRVEPLMVIVGSALVGSAFLGIVGLTIAFHDGPLDAVELGRAFIIAATTVIGTVMLCTAIPLVSLQDTELDRPVRFARAGA